MTMRERTEIEHNEQPLISCVQDWLVEHYGPISSFEQVPSPHEHRAYYPVAFVETKDSNKIVAKWSERALRLEKEYNVSKLLISHDIPTTVPIDFDATVPILTMEQLDGKPLSESDIDSSVAQEIGHLLRQIYTIPETEAIATGTTTSEGIDFADEMKILFTQRLDFASSRLPREYTPDQIHKVFDVLQKQNQWQGRRALIRRDMHAENWYRLNDGRLAAIDHGSVAIGDIAYDLACMADVLNDEPGLIAGFREGYGGDMFDEATAPPTRALTGLVRGLEMLGWVKSRGVPQPDFEAEGIALIQKAIQQANIQEE